MTSKTRSRLQLIGVLSVFAVPLILAWAWYGYVSSQGQTLGSRAFGELLPTAVPLEEFTALNAKGEAFGYEELREAWTLVHMLGAQCDDACRENLYYTRQIHTAIGKDADRVQRLVLSPQTLPSELLALHPFLTQLLGEQGDPLRTQITAAVQDLGECERCIYVIDPFGNVMMRFGADVERKKILKDLKHLLKTSRIG